MTKSYLVIYHHNCADGFTAAWVAERALRAQGHEVILHPGTYGELPPTPQGRDVILVDFSYKRKDMEYLVEVADSVTVLDHHKTAEQDLKNLPGALVVFDMERSGARIAWDHFHPDELPPQLVRYVEDRDLWKFHLPFSREVNAAVFSYEYTLVNWDSLSVKDPGDLMREGRAIERKHHKDIAELLTTMKHRIKIAGYEVPVANLPYTLASDACHAMVEGEKFAACYWDTAERRIFSLRSAKDGLDVSEIAQQYGGGGHKHAAGFSIPKGTMPT